MGENYCKCFRSIWCCGPVLPPPLADLLQHAEEDLNNSMAEVIECPENENDEVGAVLIPQLFV